jgi:hypothetical protein
MSSGVPSVLGGHCRGGRGPAAWPNLVCSMHWVARGIIPETLVRFGGAQKFWGGQGWALRV